MKDKERKGIKLLGLNALKKKKSLGHYSERDYISRNPKVLRVSVRIEQNLTSNMEVEPKRQSSLKFRTEKGIRSSRFKESENTKVPLSW